MASGPSSSTFTFGASAFAATPAARTPPPPPPARPGRSDSQSAAAATTHAVGVSMVSAAVPASAHSPLPIRRPPPINVHMTGDQSPLSSPPQPRERAGSSAGALSARGAAPFADNQKSYIAELVRTEVEGLVKTHRDEVSDLITKYRAETAALMTTHRIEKQKMKNDFDDQITKLENRLARLENALSQPFTNKKIVRGGAAAALESVHVDFAARPRATSDGSTAAPSAGTVVPAAAAAAVVPPAAGSAARAS